MDLCSNLAHHKWRRHDCLHKLVDLGEKIKFFPSFVVVLVTFDVDDLFRDWYFVQCCVDSLNDVIVRWGQIECWRLAIYYLLCNILNSTVVINRDW
jgi:hypothetical protein